MTALTIETVETVPPSADAGEWAVRFPVMAVEDLDTSDGRYLTPGQVMARACPMTILAQPFSAHDGAEPPYAVTVGRLDRMERVPGPSIVSRDTGEPFPEGTFVWVGHGAVDPTIDVHGLNIGNLLRRRFLNGASVDLAGVDAEIVGEEGMAVDPDNPRRQMIAHSATIAAVTLCPIPAFGDAYVELVDDTDPIVASGAVAADQLPDGYSREPFPAWRSAEVGDYPALVAAGDEPHTGGMIALIPASTDDLVVDGGEPADDMHLTLAYLGEDVTGWSDDQRAQVMALAEQAASAAGPVEAEVMGHAAFNPTGANDRQPCAVYLVSGAGLPDMKSAFAAADTSEHPVFLPHVTAGYGLSPSDLSYVGPVTFDRLRVALGDQVTDFPLSGASDAPAQEEGAMAAGDTPLAEPAPPDDMPMETGMPDEPQPCPFPSGEMNHPADHSLLFGDPTDQQYMPCCADHDPDARSAIQVDGFEVTGEVPITTPDDILPEETP